MQVHMSDVARDMSDLKRMLHAILPMITQIREQMADGTLVLNSGGAAASPPPSAPAGSSRSSVRSACASRIAGDLLEQSVWPPKPD